MRSTISFASRRKRWRRLISSDAAPFLMALPIAGVDGSLAARMKGTAAEGNLRAKTGTMSNIRSLAGYVTARNGEHLAFAILINNFEGTSAAANQAIDAVAVRILRPHARRSGCPRSYRPGLHPERARVAHRHDRQSDRATCGVPCSNRAQRLASAPPRPRPGYVRTRARQPHRSEPRVNWR